MTLMLSVLGKCKENEKNNNVPLITDKMRRLFDHIDLRVKDLATADVFYNRLLPLLGFPIREFCHQGVAYNARSSPPKPEFIELIEDKNHVPNATRIAFWRDSKAEVDEIAALLHQCGAINIEGPMHCPEYSPFYYAVFFEDPSGNRLEICCRIVGINNNA